MDNFRIPAFEKDHDAIGCGLSVCTEKDGITTYALRFIKPNSGRYLGNATMHSIEHIVATYLRNSEYGDKIVYFGPMGCRTGFYLLTKDLDIKTVAALLIYCAFSTDALKSVPGASQKECGNYKEHNLSNAKRVLVDFATRILVVFA